MDDRKLQVFLTTVRTGSFSKAAEELHCTQSAITQLMNGIERELGCRLLERGHNGVRLTSEGERLLPAVTEADAGLARLRQLAQQVAGQQTALIRLASFSSIVGTWLPKAIKLFKERYPCITFDIRIGTDVLTAWLQSGEIDIALGDEERCGGFRWQPLMEDPYYAVMPEAIAAGRTAVAQEELLQYPIIIAPVNRLELRLDRLLSNSINVNCDDDYALLSMIAQGLGVTALPKLCLQNVPDGVSVLELTPAAKRVIGIGTATTVGKETQVFIEFLQKYCGAEYQRCEE